MKSLPFLSRIKRIFRSNVRNRRIIVNSGLLLIVKGASIIISLIMLPAYMHYFNEQPVLLGVWLTILSVLSWVLIFDLGIGNGLRNHLIKPILTGDVFKTREYISSAYISVGFIVFIISIIGFVVFSFINWNKFFNISSNIVSPTTLLTVVRLTFIGIMLQFLFKLINSILFAMQKPAIPGILGFLSNLLLFLFLIIANSFDIESDLKTVAFVNIITVNIVLLVATLFIFLMRLKSCCPSLTLFKMKSALKIMKLGGMFFFLQLMYMVLTGTNEFIISWLAGPEKVVIYTIYNKPFGLLVMIFYLIVSPMWSEVAEAAIKNEYIWIRKAYLFFLKMAVLFFVGEIVLIFCLQFVVDIWLMENTIKINLLNSSVFALFGVVSIFNGIVSSISNGLGKLKLLFVFMLIGTLVNIPLAFLLMNMTGKWISIVIANIISMLPYCIIQAVYLYKYLRHKASCQINCTNSCDISGDVNKKIIYS